MTDAVFISGGTRSRMEPAGAIPVWYLSYEQISALEEALAYANYYELQRFFSWLERTCAGKSVQYCRAVMQQVCVVLLRQLAACGCEETDVFAECLQLLSDGLYRQWPEQVIPRLSQCSQRAALLLRGNPAGKTEEPLLEDRIIGYISRHYTDVALTLTSAAEDLGIGKTAVNNCLKRATGLSFTDYLNSVRMEKAKFLLECTENRIAEIATMCGFSSSRYFSAVFKSSAQLTPAQYREKTRDGCPKGR